MYTMEIKSKERIFLITMSGFMTEEESLAYIKEYKEKIKSINSSEYNIVVDGKELKTTSQKLIGLIQEAQNLIANTPFKQRYSIMPKSTISTSQIKRVSSENKVFDDTIFVESYEEVLKLLK